MAAIEECASPKAATCRHRASGRSPFFALLEQLNIEHVDLLKIDVEAAEREIFEDAARWIDRVSVICVELHDRFRPGCSKTFEIATAAFPVRWRRGELHCIARKGRVSVV